MFVKKFLSQPNIVGSVLIALLICAGIVYAFGFNGFNVQTATNGNVDAWLAQAGDGNCGGGGGDENPPCDCNPTAGSCNCGNMDERNKSGKWKRPCGGTEPWPCILKCATGPNHPPHPCRQKTKSKGGQWRPPQCSHGIAGVPITKNFKVCIAEKKSACTSVCK